METRKNRQRFLKAQRTFGSSQHDPSEFIRRYDEHSDAGSQNQKALNDAGGGLGLGLGDEAKINQLLDESEGGTPSERRPKLVTKSSNMNAINAPGTPRFGGSQRNSGPFDGAMRDDRNSRKAPFSPFLRDPGQVDLSVNASPPAPSFEFEKPGVDQNDFIVNDIENKASLVSGLQRDNSAKNGLVGSGNPAAPLAPLQTRGSVSNFRIKAGSSASGGLARSKSNIV